MALYRCKMCGGELAFEPGSTIAVCEYCGTRQTVSSAGDEKRINLFNRANRLRMNSEFDRAATIYEQIIAEFPEDAEAYWGLCLCNYGIEYVDDAATGKKLPTCHRASFDMLRKDENYELALENADMSARLVYQEEAKEIDRIMGEILSISKNESPYDVFICYKETDNNGSRTKDSVIAQDIYDVLTERGYKVFFSRITLEDKLGQQYEPYIFAALNSAKVMLAVGTDYENFNSAWVKNEWSRFLRLIAKDRIKVLIPCYKDMDPYTLPDEFKGLQAQDLNKLGFMQDLLRGIDKIIGRPSAGTQTVVLQNESSAERILERAFALLEESDWGGADSCAERVLDLDRENGEAYLVKLLSEVKVNKLEYLAGSDVPFEKNKNYQKAIQYLKNEDRKLLEEQSSTQRERISTKRKRLSRLGIILISVACACIAIISLVVNVLFPYLKLRKALPDLVSADVGDYVVFGIFEQDNNSSNGEEPIEWQILSKEGNRILVISRYALECMPFDASKKEVSWEDSSIRKWLNGGFFREAFSVPERQMIQNISLTSDSNESSRGKKEEDKVFLFSIDEVDKYFHSDKERQCQGTAYCYAQGAESNNRRISSNRRIKWWLRSSGHNSETVAFVYFDGSTNNYGDYAGSSAYTVRPVIVIDLDS